MSPICDFEGCNRDGRHQTFVDDNETPRGITAGWWCSKHFEWAFYKALDKAKAATAAKAIALAEKWCQGAFLDMPRYKGMPAEWKEEQSRHEKSLILEGAPYPERITGYLEELGKLLADAEEAKV